jgi:hypothetical protein
MSKRRMTAAPAPWTLHVRTTLAGRIGLAIACGLWVSTIVAPLRAQVVEVRTGVFHTVTGVVMDADSMPLPNVTVMIRKLQRQTLTGADGTFRLDSIPAGTHELTARAVGLLSGVQYVTAGPNMTPVTITMIRYRNTLAAMVTTADELGLSGIIGDTMYRALAGVKVTAIGGSEIAYTDSTGAFHMPLKPGQYMLRIDKDGYARQTVGVSLPEDQGRKIAVWMAERHGGDDPVYGRELFDLGQRMVRASPTSSKFLTREDMSAMGAVDLQALAIRFQTGRITQDCLVQLGGTINRMVPLGNLTAADIEFVELYLPTVSGAAGGGSGKPRGVTSLSGHQPKFLTPSSLSPTPGASSACGNVGFIAWLRN